MADDTQSYDFLQQVVKQFARVIKTMVDYLDNAELSAIVLMDLGLNPDIAAPLDIDSELARVDVYLASTDPDLEAFLAVVDDLSRISEAIVSFVELMSTDANELEMLQQLSYELMMLSNLAEARYRYPSAVAIGEMFGIINLGLEDYDRFSILGGPLGNIFQTLKQGVETNSLTAVLASQMLSIENEADAKALSDVVLLPIAGLMAAQFLKANKSNKNLNVDLLYGWDVLNPEADVDLISDRILSFNLRGKRSRRGERLFVAPDGPDTESDHLGEVDRDLDAREIHALLIQAFTDAEISLSSEAAVVLKKAGRHWQLIDGLQRFVIRRETETKDLLTVYDLPTKDSVQLSGGITFVPEDHGGPGFLIAVGGGGDVNVPLNADWQLKINHSVPTGFSIFVHLVDAQQSRVFGPPDARLKAQIVKRDQTKRRLATLGDEHGTSLSFGGLTFELEVAHQKVDIRAISVDNVLTLSLIHI